MAESPGSGRGGTLSSMLYCAQLGLVVLVGDRGEHLGVVEVRLHVLVDEVELDLQPGHRPVELEGARPQHPLEDVEVLAHLLAVPLALLPGVALRADLCSHVATQPHRDLRGNPGAAFRSRPMSHPSPTVTGVRLIHTSDWHLGRSFHQVGLLDAQAAYLDHLVEVVRSERVDAVLVSGDVYDRAMPSPDTVALLSQALVRLVDAGAQVVLSSGNHDSATRLGFASDLLERAGVHVRTAVADIGRPVVLGDVAVHPLPYLEPALAAEPLGATERTHAGVLRAAMDRVRADAAHRGGRTVVMAHAFVTGGVTSESERDISVGGVSAVPPEVFAGADYAALGHLHGRQEVADGVRYSGSPVAMSFSEWRHTKVSLLVDLSGDRPSVEHVEAPVARPLAVLRGTLDELLADPAHRAAETAWCQVTLTDPARPLGAMEQLRRRFPHTLELRFDPEGATVPLRPYAARVAATSDVDVCCDFLSHVRGGRGASDDERALLDEAVEATRVARQVGDDEGVVHGGADRTASGAAGAA